MTDRRWKLLLATGYVTAALAGLYFGNVQSSSLLRAQEPYPGSDEPAFKPKLCYVQRSDGSWEEVSVAYEEHRSCQNPQDCFSPYNSICLPLSNHLLPECEECSYWRIWDQVYKVGTCETHAWHFCNRCSVDSAFMVCAAGLEFRDAACTDECPNENSPCSFAYGYRGACIAGVQDPEP